MRFSSSNAPNVVHLQVFSFCLQTKSPLPPLPPQLVGFYRLRHCTCRSPLSWTHRLQLQLPSQDISPPGLSKQDSPGGLSGAFWGLVSDNTQKKICLGGWVGGELFVRFHFKHIMKLKCDVICSWLSWLWLSPL